METNHWPRISKTYKIGDKVICVDSNHPYYMKKAKVVYFGKPKGKKNKVVGVEFSADKKDKKKHNKHGIIFATKFVRKIVGKFNVKDYRIHFEKKKDKKGKSVRKNSSASG